ncbi:protein spire-like isoform X2 [Amphibalanus amphitrite]|uniref:protein spire-like isoform X2 n=1 Tax=Amphibalanus amphitrite TaxID=1232801 RepID=UPI001C91FB35|nr:protein spire-like isoform X2 [Amphibalanus amphitrite]
MSEEMTGEGVGAPSAATDPTAVVSLQAILEAFSAPISEEQAWAVCHQCAQAAHSAWSQDRHACWLVTDLAHVRICADGTVHPATWDARQAPAKGTAPHTEKTPGPEEEVYRKIAANEQKLVYELGVVIFRALDYGMKSDEERQLSPSLEELIDSMTSSGRPFRRSLSSPGEKAETDDEGIERDSGDSDDDPHIFRLREVIERCANHLERPASSEQHFKAVCRALVAETLELTTFLRVVRQGTSELRRITDERDHNSGAAEMDELNRHQWGRLWVQIIGELRRGVKLKKVECTYTPTEFELTPYEMLMDDIRSRRFKLRKVMVDGDIPPRVKKDAHALILEFIRGRPPLKKVSERKISSAPMSPRKISTHERLMESIRKQEHSLKKTPSAPPRKVSGVPVGTVKDDPPAAAPQSGRRLIKADPSLAVPCSTTFDDDDDDPDFPETPATPYCPEPAPRDGLGLGYRTGGTGTGSGSGSGIGSGIGGTPSHWQHNMALDLATQRVSFKSDRRHTLCEPPMSRSRPGSALSDRSSGSEETPLPHQPGSHVASELQRQFLASSQWSDMDCLSLTLDEVVHIRSVLTKAELDSLPVECHIKEDVARGKLCFLCMKTRFSFFGAKGNNCRLCQRVVCAKCCAKMRIPTEHFASIPVYTLTPSSLSPQEEEARSLLSRLQVPELPNFTSSGSGGSPTSPANSRDSPEQQCQSLPPQPLLQQVESKLRRTRLYRSRTLARPEDLESPRSSEGDRDDLGGVLMTVCKDCKAMVLHIIGTWKKRRDRSKRASAPARPRSLFIAAVR